MTAPPVIFAWLLSLITFLAPPEKLAAAPQLKGWEETAEQKTARYESIAADVYSVVYADGAKRPYRGKLGRSYTAALLISIAFMESGFARDVDKGPCYRNGSFRFRCDGGRSVGMWQAQLGEGETLLAIHGIEGLKQADIFADRKVAVSIAMHMVVRSFKACRLLGPEAALNVYASGSCSRGQTGGLARLLTAKRLLRNRPPSWKDDVQAMADTGSENVDGGVPTAAVLP